MHWLVMELKRRVWGEEVRVMEGWWGPDLYYMVDFCENPVYWLCGVLLLKKGGVLGKQEGVRGCLDFAILLICHCTHHVLCLSFSTFSRSYQGRVRRERDRVVFSS